MIFTVEPVRGPDGLRLAYSTQGSGPWQVVRVRLLDNALNVTEEDEGRVYVPHRLGIERAASKAFPGSENWRTYDGLSMAMCGLVKEGSALLVNWDCVDTQLHVNGSWPDLPLVGGRRAYGVTLEMESPQGACTRTEIARAKQAGRLANLARNGDFSSSTAKSMEGTGQKWHDGLPPAGWSAWQRDDSKGTFTWDREAGAAGKGAARASRVTDGCFLQSYNLVR